MNGIRKAAVFLCGLDWETADRLLKQLDREQAQLVRSEMVRLNDISQEERDAVAHAFLQKGQSDFAQHRCDFDMFETSQNVHDLQFVQATPQMQQTQFVEPCFDCETEESCVPRYFSFFETEEPIETAMFLVDENPQMIAVVLSELSPRYSGETLLCFEQSLRADLVRRLANLHETDEAVLEEIDGMLRARFTLMENAMAVPGAKNALDEMLRHADSEMEQEILASLHQQYWEKNGEDDDFYDDTITEQPPFNTFEDLIWLQDHELAILYRTSDQELALISLIDANPDLVARVFAGYTSREQMQMYEQLLRYQHVSQEEIHYARACLFQNAKHIMGAELEY